MPEPGAPAIDRAVIDELLQATGGDRAFLADLVDAFLADAPLQLTAMRAAVASGSAADLVRPVHTLKSSSASLGALGLAGHCRALEAQARGGSLEGAAEAVEAIGADLDTAMAELSALAGRP